MKLSPRGPSNHQFVDMMIMMLLRTHKSTTRFKNTPKKIKSRSSCGFKTHSGVKANWVLDISKDEYPLLSG